MLKYWHSYRRLILGMACLLMLLAQPFGMRASAAGAAVAPKFQRFYAENGGAAILGSPLSGELDVDGLRVQYFERARLEWHTEYAGTENEILLTALGRILTANRTFAQSGPRPGVEYFPQTGYTLSGGFAAFWHAHRGLQLFGYPISDELRERSSVDGQMRTVQYFERARMEWLDGQGVYLDTIGTQYYNLSPNNRTGSKTADSDLSIFERGVFDPLMAARAAAGAPAPQIDPNLTALARQRSEDMAARQYFSHTTPEGKTIFVLLNEAGITWQYAGEVISRNNYNNELSPGVAADAYLASEPHRAVIVDPQYNAAGVGHAIDRTGMHYYTIIFVRR